MPAPSREALSLAERWSLALLERPRRGPAGERLATGTGASLELQDRRPYVLGDDPRRIDWRAYGRTEELLVHVHREEVAPRLDLLLDCSRSMRVGEEKAQRALDLAGLLLAAARADGAGVRCVALGDEARRVEPDELEREGVELAGARELARALHEASAQLRPGSVRVLVSDGLTPEDPALVARLLARNAGGLAVVQVLGAEERRPEPGHALRLVDAESGAARELVLDEAAVARYRERLERLIRDLAGECRRLGGAHALVEAEEPLEEVCRDALAPAGVLAPRTGRR